MFWWNELPFELKLYWVANWLLFIHNYTSSASTI